MQVFRDEIYKMGFADHLKTVIFYFDTYPENLLWSQLKKNV